MIDLLRLKAVGAGLAFGYAIVKDCDKRFQAHCRRRPAQVTFNSIVSTPLQMLFIAAKLHCARIVFIVLNCLNFFNHSMPS